VKKSRSIDPVTRRYVPAKIPVVDKITACFSEEEALRIASYARNYGLTTSEFVRRSMLEKIAHVPMLEGR